MTFSLHSFTIGIIGGVLIGAVLFATKDAPLLPSIQTPPVTESTSTVPKTMPKSGALSVVDQPSGSDVLIESVTVPAPGVWIAIREMNGDDLGNVLGAARVKGPASSVIVHLLRDTAPERKYTAMLYRADNGDVFDPAVNSVYVDYESGARVTESFLTTE